MRAERGQQLVVRILRQPRCEASTYSEQQRDEWQHPEREGRAAPGVLVDQPAHGEAPVRVQSLPSAAIFM